MSKQAPEQYIYGGALSSRALIGAGITNDEGESLGILKDIMLDPDRGTATYVRVEFMGDKQFIIPFHDLNIDPKSGQLRVPLSKKVLERTHL